jgi:hypothetical protein
MNPGESFDPNPFFLGVELGLGAVIVGGRIVRRHFPKIFRESWMDWFEWLVLIVATLVLMRFAFPGWARLTNAKSILHFVVPYAAIVLWVLVMLAFASALRNQRKDLEDAAKQLDACVARAYQAAEQRVEMVRAELSAELENVRSLMPVKTGGLGLEKRPTDRKFDPLRHRDEITRAVCVKRKISQTDFVGLPFSYSTDFITFWPRRSDLETWLVQELEDPVVTKNLQRQIEILSVSADGDGRKYIPKVVVIMMVYRVMSLDEKGSLLHQLEAVKANGNLSSKITFQVWDKDDL